MFLQFSSFPTILLFIFFFFIFFFIFYFIFYLFYFLFILFFIYFFYYLNLLRVIFLNRPNWRKLKFDIQETVLCHPGVFPARLGLLLKARQSFKPLLDPISRFPSSVVENGTDFPIFFSILGQTNFGFFLFFLSVTSLDLCV